MQIVVIVGILISIFILLVLTTVYFQSIHIDHDRNKIQFIMICNSQTSTDDISKATDDIFRTSLFPENINIIIGIDRLQYITQQIHHTCSNSNKYLQSKLQKKRNKNIANIQNVSFIAISSLKRNHYKIDDLQYGYSLSTVMQRINKQVLFNDIIVCASAPNTFKLCNHWDSKILEMYSSGIMTWVPSDSNKCLKLDYYQPSGNKWSKNPIFDNNKNKTIISGISNLMHTLSSGKSVLQCYPTESNTSDATLINLEGMMGYAETIDEILSRFDKSIYRYMINRKKSTNIIKDNPQSKYLIKFIQTLGNRQMKRMNPNSLNESFNDVVDREIQDKSINRHIFLRDISSGCRSTILECYMASSIAAEKNILVQPLDNHIFAGDVFVDPTKWTISKHFLNNFF